MNNRRTDKQELESKLKMEMNNKRSYIQSLYTKLECDHEKLVKNLAHSYEEKMIGSIIIAALIVILVSVSVLYVR